MLNKSTHLLCSIVKELLQRSRQQSHREIRDAAKRHLRRWDGRWMDVQQGKHVAGQNCSYPLSEWNTCNEHKVENTERVPGQLQGVMGFSSSTMFCGVAGVGDMGWQEAVLSLVLAEPGRAPWAGRAVTHRLCFISQIFCFFSFNPLAATTLFYNPLLGSLKSTLVIKHVGACE